MYFVYIIQSLSDDSYYVGHTDDLKDRIERHNSGRSKSTKSKIPWKLVYKEEFFTRSEAMKREYKIKKMKSRKHIEYLIKESKVKMFD